MFDNVISGQPYWMTSYLVGHVGWPLIRMAMLDVLISGGRGNPPPLPPAMRTFNMVEGIYYTIRPYLSSEIDFMVGWFWSVTRLPFVRFEPKWYLQAFWGLNLRLRSTSRSSDFLSDSLFLAPGFSMAILKEADVTSWLNGYDAIQDGQPDVTSEGWKILSWGYWSCTFYSKLTSEPWT